MDRCCTTDSGCNKRIRLVLLILVVLFVVGCDQYSKYLITHQLNLYEVICVIPGFLNITFITNVGTAFGFLASIPAVYRNTLLVFSYLFSFFVLVYFYNHLVRLHKGVAGIVAVGLVAGGAIGNVVDRVLYGWVVDFIDVYLGKYHWPTFNVADSCITLGIFFTTYVLLCTCQKGQSLKKDA